MRIAAFASALLLPTVLSTAADAQIIVTGDTTGNPTWNRVLNSVGGLSAIGTNVPFETVEVTIIDSTGFRAEAVGGTAVPDTTMALYVGSFDPTAQATNLVAYDDDGGADLLSRIDSALDGPFPEGEYIIVVTGFDNTDFGAYVLEIDGATLGFGPTLDEIQRDLEVGFANIVIVSSLGRSAQLYDAIKRGFVARDSVPAPRSVADASDDVSLADLGVTTDRLTPQGLYVWGNAGHRQAENDDDIEAELTFVQAGMDVMVPSAGPFDDIIAGLSFGGGDTSTETAASSLDGETFWVQPYVAARTGALIVGGAFAVSLTDFDDIGTLSGAASGESIGYAASGFASFGIDAGNGLTVSPFVSGSTGVGELRDLDGALAGQPDSEVFFAEGAAGAEVSRGFSFDLPNGMGAHARAFVSAELGVQYSDADTDALSTADFDQNRVGAGLGAGVDVAVAEFVTLGISGSADGIGTDLVSYGGEARLGLHF